MSYAGTAELAQKLHLRSVSAEQGTALQRVLDSAAYEINSECNGSGTVDFGTPYPALAIEVNIERAVEHWQQQESAFGILGLGADSVPCVAKTENCFCTFALEQSGQVGVSPLRTSSSKCDSHFMQTYS